MGCRQMSLDRSKMLVTPRIAMMVRRYHTWPVFNYQTIGDHVGNSLMIWSLVFGAVTHTIAEYIIRHDLGELVAGDPPYPSKARNPEYKKAHAAVEHRALLDMQLPLPVLSEETLVRLKAVDLIDMLEFGLVELHMGNKFAVPIIDDVLLNLRGLTLSPIEREAVASYVSKVLTLFGNEHASDIW